MSGVVVVLDEEKHLAECLTAIGFCDEIVVVDLGSTDRSRVIARQHGARIVEHPRVAAVELVRKFAVDQTRGAWIAFMDPDMIFPIQVTPRILDIMAADTKIGVIYLNYRNHFRGRPVRFGRWGGSLSYPALFRREAMDLLPYAHRGFRLRPGYESTTVGRGESETIVHHWIETPDQLCRRIERYTPLEGEARYAAGERFRVRGIIVGAPLNFLKSYLLQRGFLDGWRGLYLSWVSARLTVTFALALRDIQRRCESIPVAVDE